MGELNVGEDDYFLKWEKHHHSFVNVFYSLLEQRKLVDCSLVAENNVIKAHRIVLMACSNYLYDLLSKHPDEYPVVNLDVSFSVLKLIVAFCYKGEVKVTNDLMVGFIGAAMALQIKGLSPDVIKSDIFESQLDSVEVPTISENQKQNVNVIEHSENGTPTDDKDTSGEEISDGVDQGEPHFALVENDTNNLDLQGSDASDFETNSESGLDEFDDLDVSAYMRSGGALLFPWMCNRCSETFSTRVLLDQHRKTCKLFLGGHPWKCVGCNKAYKNKKDLRRHMTYCGKDRPRLVCKLCGNTYKYERGLQRHAKYCGTDVKPVKCHDCDKTYKYKRGLRRHQRRCAIIKALKILSEKGVVPVVMKQRIYNRDRTTVTNETSKLDKAPKNDSKKNCSNDSTNSRCRCGKVYKYCGSLKKHLLICAENKLSDSVM